MGSFGQDLRAERLARGIALEQITGITKISQRHLVALEEDRLRALPGGILTKGIVRGYLSAVGLDVRQWTERFLNEAGAILEPSQDDQAWAAFATNVGRSRILRHEANQLRMRWIGAAVLMSIVSIAAFVTVRYWGVRAGWWSSLLPLHPVVVKAASVSTSILRFFFH
jgi:cytoskeleton protein RodZ